MLRRGGERDVGRAASWFVKWWREEGGLASASAPAPGGGSDEARAGWGFDLEWTSTPGKDGSVQTKMEECIDSYLVSVVEEEQEVSPTQVKKMVLKERMAKRMAKRRARLDSR